MNVLLWPRKAGRGTVLLIIALALGIFLTGCATTDTGTDAQTSQEEPTEELKPLEPVELIKIAEDGSPSGAGFYIATERGYFAELGLESEYVTFQSSAYMLPALAAGQVDVAGGIMTTSFLNAVERGLDIKIIADKAAIYPASRILIWLLLRIR